MIAATDTDVTRCKAVHAFFQNLLFVSSPHTTTDDPDRPAATTTPPPPTTTTTTGLFRPLDEEQWSLLHTNVMQALDPHHQAIPWTPEYRILTMLMEHASHFGKPHYAHAYLHHYVRLFRHGNLSVPPTANLLMQLLEAWSQTPSSSPHSAQQPPLQMQALLQTIWLPLYQQLGQPARLAPTEQAVSMILTRLTRAGYWNRAHDVLNDLRSRVAAATAAQQTQEHSPTTSSSSASSSSRRVPVVPFSLTPRLFNQLMHAHARHDKRRVDQVQALFETMIDDYKSGRNPHCHPDVTSFGTLMTALSKQPLVRAGPRKPPQSPHGPSPTKHHHLPGEEAEEDPHQAAAQVCEQLLHLLLELYQQQKQTAETTPTTNNINNNNNNIHTDQTDLRPSPHVFGIVMDAWSKANQPQKATDTLRHMMTLDDDDDTILPTMHHYNVILNAWARAAMVESFSQPVAARELELLWHEFTTAPQHFRPIAATTTTDAQAQPQEEEPPPYQERLPQHVDMWPLQNPTSNTVNDDDNNNNDTRTAARQCLFQPNRFSYMARINVWERSQRTIRDPVSMIQSMSEDWNTHAANQAVTALQQAMTITTNDGTDRLGPYPGDGPTKLHLYTRTICAVGRTANLALVQELLNQVLTASQQKGDTELEPNDSLLNFCLKTCLHSVWADLGGRNPSLEHPTNAAPASLSSEPSRSAAQQAEDWLNQLGALPSVCPNVVSYNIVLECWAYSPQTTANAMDHVWNLWYRMRQEPRPSHTVPPDPSNDKRPLPQDDEEFRVPPPPHHRVLVPNICTFNHVLHCIVHNSHAYDPSVKVQWIQYVLEEMKKEQQPFDPQRDALHGAVQDFLRRHQEPTMEGTRRR